MIASLDLLPPLFSLPDAVSHSPTPLPHLLILLFPILFTPPTFPPPPPPHFSFHTAPGPHLFLCHLFIVSLHLLPRRHLHAAVSVSLLFLSASCMHSLFLNLSPFHNLLLLFLPSLTSPSSFRSLSLILLASLSLSSTDSDCAHACARGVRARVRVAGGKHRKHWSLLNNYHAKQSK